MTYILYSYWRSSCSYRVRIAMNLKQVPYEYRSIHLVREGGQQYSQEFLEKNPMGQVPCLLDSDQDRALSQSITIIDYLELKHPEPALYPKDPYQALLVRQLCEMINSGIQPLQNLGVLQQLGSRFGAGQNEKNEWAAHFIQKGLQAMENLVKPTAGTFCFGDTLSAAEVFLIPQVYGAIRFGIDMDSLPTLKRINDHCLTLEAFKNAEPSAQPDAE